MVLMFTSCTDHFLTADSCNKDSADFNLLIIPNWFINVWMMNIYIHRKDFLTGEKASSKNDST